MSRPMLNGELLFPNDYLAAEEMEQDTTYTVRDAQFDDLQTRDGSKERKPVLYFKETKKKLVLNKTNATQIAKQHGPEAREWTGKRITLYATTCQAFGQTVDCIRVRSHATPPSTGNGSPGSTAMSPVLTEQAAALEIAPEATGEPDPVLGQFEQHKAAVTMYMMQNKNEPAAKEAKLALAAIGYPPDDPVGIYTEKDGKWKFMGTPLDSLDTARQWYQEQKGD